MEDNLFTIFWWLLPYINMNHPRMHMCLPILNTPSPRSSPPHPSILIEIVLKLSIHLEELTLLLCCLQIYKHSIALHLSRSLFWCFFVLFCFFPQLGNSLRTGNCDNGGAPFICSSLSKMFFFLVSDGTVNLIPVIPSWIDEEVSKQY